LKQLINTLQLKTFYYILVLILVFSGRAVQAQQVDSIFFHLYTDSLKKGVHNYINVDGKLSNGQWQPLTAKDLHFTASAGRFEGNDLIVDTSFKGEKIDVKATLKANPQLWKEITIYIKTVDTTERLKTMKEVLPGSSSPGRKSKKSRRNP
jgi:hypothetical protein